MAQMRRTTWWVLGLLGLMSACSCQNSSARGRARTPSARIEKREAKLERKKEKRKQSATSNTPPSEQTVPAACAVLPSIAPKPADTLRFVTVNSDGGVESFRGLAKQGLDRPFTEHLDCLANLVTALDGDLVFLSEMHRFSPSWQRWDMADELEQRVERRSSGWSIAFEQSCRITKDKGTEGRIGVVGNALLARTKQGDQGASRVLGVPLPTDIKPDRESGVGEWWERDGQCMGGDDEAARNRGRQKVAMLAVGPANIDVVGVHLSPGKKNGDLRRRQLDEVNKRYQEFAKTAHPKRKDSQGPAIAVGDFNEGDTVYETLVGALGSDWKNATAAVQYDRKLDHIFTRNLDVVGAHELHVTFLNHHVLYVDVRVPAKKE